VKATLLVSLLERDDSDRLFAEMHRVLRPVDAAHLALVAPPEPAIGAAALQLSGREIATVIPAGPRRPEQRGNAGSRCYVWCRDELEVEAWSTHPAMPVLAATVEELGWELVRRLTGDLRDAEEESSLATIAEPGSEPAATSVADLRVAAAGPWHSKRSIRVPVGRERGMPPTPTWARAARAEEPAPQIVSLAAQSSDEALAFVDTDNGVPGIEQGPGGVPVASRTAITPLAAMAQRLRASQAGSNGRAQAEVVDNTARRPSQRGLQRVRDLIGRRVPMSPRQAEPDLAALGQALFRAHSTLVTVGTPKGGPGKTTEAAALGILGARAVEPHGGSAVLVDANLNNPDAWRQLGVPSDALTVREVVEALNRGTIVPNGEFARNERLRVLPERRAGGVAYGAHEIARLAQHLRLRHTLIAVDLPNSLPSLGAGPSEAVVAHWLQHADVAVIPIDLGEASFIAAGELLDALEAMVAKGGGAMQVPGLVIPLLLPPNGRRALQLSVIASVLDHFRDAGAAVVEVPYSIDVQTASQRRTSVVGASRGADHGFAGVLSAVVAARQAQVMGVRRG